MGQQGLMGNIISPNSDKLNCVGRPPWPVEVEEVKSDPSSLHRQSSHLDCYSVNMLFGRHWLAAAPIIPEAVSVSNEERGVKRLLLLHAANSLTPPSYFGISSRWIFWSH